MPLTGCATIVTGMSIYDADLLDGFVIRSIVFFLPLGNRGPKVICLFSRGLLNAIMMIFKNQGLIYDLQWRV